MADNEFWQYSLLIYNHPGVRSACLQLQDDHDADVNLLLCACWLAWRGYSWDAAQLGDILKLSEPFRSEYLLPVRAMRRRLKEAGAENVYNEAKRFELALERWQQDELFRYWQAQSPRDRGQSFSACAYSSFCRYLEAVEPGRNRPRKLLQELIDAAEQAQKGMASS